MLARSTEQNYHIRGKESIRVTIERAVPFFLIKTGKGTIIEAAGRRMVKTKIIATIGPASNTYTTLRKMMVAGVDVARLNFSHGKNKEHANVITLIRGLNKKYKRHIRILQDLEGFRIRVGNLPGGKRFLKKRDMVFFVPEGTAKGPNIIPIDYKESLKRIGPGKIIYIDDGNIILKVIDSTTKQVKAEVIIGGPLKQRKGINIPNVSFPVGGLTEKDKKDIVFGTEKRVDYVAQSFVRRKKDVTEVRERTREKNPGCKIIAKIETKEAIRGIDGIIDEADGIMIARGDMGIAVPVYDVPIIQKEIIKKCNKKKKFVITATQMLESMTEHNRPTRAETTDVANAILDGTDFVMLSGETAAGSYPEESVKTMNKIIIATERYKGRGKKGITTDKI